MGASLLLIRLDPPTCRALRTPVRVGGSRCKILRRWRDLVLGCNHAGSDPPALLAYPYFLGSKRTFKIAPARPHKKRMGRGRGATPRSARPRAGVTAARRCDSAGFRGAQQGASEHAIFFVFGAEGGCLREAPRAPRRFAAHLDFNWVG